MKVIYNNPNDLDIEVFNSIKVGDSISQGKKPMKVLAVSDNYIFAVQNNFGKMYYSIFAKKPSTTTYNEFYYPNCRKTGYYYCGPMDNWGGSAVYDIKTEEGARANLMHIESGDSEISWKRNYTYKKLTVWYKESKNGKRTKI